MHGGRVREPDTQNKCDPREADQRLNWGTVLPLRGREALRRADCSDSNTEGAFHALLPILGKRCGRPQTTPLDTPNLLQTIYNRLVLGTFPADSSLGADWTRFKVCLDRREGRRRTPGSAAFFCAMMDDARGADNLSSHLCPPMFMPRAGMNVGHTFIPLGMSALVDGKATAIRSTAALGPAPYTLRRATGMRHALVPAYSVSRALHPTSLKV